MPKRKKKIRTYCHHLAIMKIPGCKDGKRDCECLLYNHSRVFSGANRLAELQFHAFFIGNPGIRIISIETELGVDRLFQSLIGRYKPDGSPLSGNLIAQFELHSTDLRKIQQQLKLSHGRYGATKIGGAVAY